LSSPPFIIIINIHLATTSNNDDMLSLFEHHPSASGRWFAPLLMFACVAWRLAPRARHVCSAECVAEEGD
jgi:hypothetical protein